MRAKDLLLLVDTSVWLDLFIPSNSGHKAAWDFVRAAAEYEDDSYRDIKLLYPARVMGDVFYKVRLEAKRWIADASMGTSNQLACACRDHAWDCVKDMHALGTAVGVDESDVSIAIGLRSLHEDLEDDFVLAAIERSDADYLVTSDTKLARKARIPALSSDEMASMLRGGDTLGAGSR